MADNKYRKYLNGDDEQSSRFSFSNIAAGVGRALAVGATAVGAVYGIKHLSSGALDVVGGLDKIRKASSYLEGYMGGLNKTVKSAGFLRTISGAADDELRANLRKTMAPAVTGAMRSIDGYAPKVLSSIEDLSVIRRDIAEGAMRDTRLELIKQDLRNKAAPEVYDELLKTLTYKKSAALRAKFDKGNVRPINNAVNMAIEHLKLGNYTDPRLKAQWESGVVTLKNTLDQYNRKNFLEYLDPKKQGKFRSDIKDSITRQIEAMKEATNRAIVEDAGKLTNASRLITSRTFDTGMKQLTVGELLKEQISGTPIMNIGLPSKQVVVQGKDSLKRFGVKSHNQLQAFANGLSPELREQFLNSAVDPMIFRVADGRISDLRFMGRVKNKVMTTLSNNVQVPLLGLRPFKLLSIFNRETIESMPKFFTFERGTIMPAINNSVEALKEDHLYAAGRLLKYNRESRSAELVRDNVYLASSKFGAFQRSAAAQSGITKRTAVEPSGILGHLKSVLDIGSQEYTSSLKGKMSFFTKFWDLDWGRNLWYTVSSKSFDSAKDKDKLKHAIGKIYNIVDNSTSALDRSTLEVMQGYLTKTKGVDKIFGDILTGSSESTIDAIYSLVKSAEAGDVKLAHLQDFKSIINRYNRNPSSFEKVTRTVKHGYSYAVPEVLEGVQPGTVDLLTSFDEAEKLLHMELLHQAQSATGKKITVGEMVRELTTQGKMTDRQADKVMDLWLLNDLKTKLGMDGKVTDTGAGVFAGMMQNPLGLDQAALRSQLESKIKRTNPILGFGPGESHESTFKGNDFILINRARNPIKEVNEVIKRGGNVKDVMNSIAETTVGQLGFGPASIRAGRGNLDKVTTATHASYYYLFRLNEGLGQIGLGLSYKNMGSTQDIAKNMFLLRYLGPAALIAGLGYMNYEAGNLTGEKPSQSLAKTYAGMTLDVQKAKDVLGINYFGRHFNNIMPGLDKLYENPLGIALKYSSFGLLGDSRGYDELKYFYEKGYSPMRKGRFWGIGSSTPWYGGRIDYWAPSWYRTTMGQPEMTDSLYGSEGEYWANHWLPNPRNPIGILKTFADPYHWENKHREDRPYPVTGGIPQIEGIPLVGPLLSGTVGRVIKPPRYNKDLSKAHRQYLTDINQRYTDFINSAESGATIIISPGGRITPVSRIEGTVEGSVYGNGGGSALASGGGIAGGIPGGAAPSESGYVRMVDPTKGFSPTQSGRTISNMELTAINQNWVAKSNLKPIDGRSIQLLRDHMYVDSISEAMDPNSLLYRLSETWYSATEIGGIYGFMGETIFGDMTPRTILQPSSAMTSWQRRFWDKNLGGMGGELSEIYRRFMPRRRKNIQEYNPLRNTMPEWMPGLDYFTDFKHGDPYIKIPQGEARLPGKGYEAINKLHPDFFGEYGALDRFKILGDVAPWSAQYTYYNKVVSRMYQSGMLSEEDYSDVQKMREMVTQRKEKYDMYPYKFQGSDIEKHSVTVQRMIDADTFMTNEFPGIPIRLAGIRLSNADTPEGEEQRAALANYVSPGKKIQIGIDSDPLMRFNNDVMGTMSAVVYDSWGDPVQARLARSKMKVNADWKDTSATAVNALYSRGDITVGKIWEGFAHLDTPFHTKFLQIRSPLEMYERQLVYGKEWQSWSHPIKNWIEPTVDKLTAQNPLKATLVGAAIGSLFGVFGKSKGWGTLIGGTIGGLSSSIRTVGDLAKRTIGGKADATWIPKRRQEQRKIEEYFDMLKYIKYSGLYEKTRRMAVLHEGLDPEKLLQYSKSKSRMTSSERRRLEHIKRWLKVSSTDGVDIDREEAQLAIDAINESLNGIASDTIAVNAGPITMRALQYKQEISSTLYGADPYGDLQNIYKALPKKDRPFFTKFMLAKPDEREKILRLVPDNQKRFYQAKWGLPVDEVPELADYFKSHYLPDANWEGWKPDVSLEEVKLKFVNQQALEVTEFGFWEDDLRYAKNAPSLPSINQVVPNIDVARLRKVLNGMGISNADVAITRETTDKPDNLFNVAVNLVNDRTQDVISAINDNIGSLLLNK